MEVEAASNNSGQVWRQRIEAQRASGLSIRAWCRQEGHHEHSFYWWRVRLGLSRKSVGASPRAAVQSLKFARIVVDPTVAEHRGSESIRLRLAGGRELQLPVSMAVEQIAQLVRAIEGIEGAA